MGQVTLMSGLIWSRSEEMRYGRLIEISDEILWSLFTFVGGGLGADKDKEEDFESSMGGGISFSAKTFRTQACHGGGSFSPIPRPAMCYSILYEMQVFDENRLTRDDFLGRVELPLVSLPREAEVIITSFGFLSSDYDLVVVSPIPTFIIRTERSPTSTTYCNLEVQDPR